MLFSGTYGDAGSVSIYKTNIESSVFRKNVNGLARNFCRRSVNKTCLAMRDSSVLMSVNKFGA